MPLQQREVAHHADHAFLEKVVPHWTWGSIGTGSDANGVCWVDRRWRRQWRWIVPVGNFGGIWLGSWVLPTETGCINSQELLDAFSFMQDEVQPELDSGLLRNNGDFFWANLNESRVQ